ncbi:uncharacterized protein B0I36DRAFT_277100 [Microdochium trichocladiopsis]|uniref:Nucleoside phosphorylase domain-containing protein n=1 Tax=Microdochium trichocladiopsis TaxID=1682393 RepID=A0A9P8XV83_9PEZI|nr:uncharacterized protein B0I36DRAFT_277100 [Microdochium trichocladiopsis]KAH7018505.1 hypothetical protein B0I36DRAFT_277100 [Microdochium trichocladiopsis]
MELSVAEPIDANGGPSSVQTQPDGSLAKIVIEPTPRNQSLYNEVRTQHEFKRRPVHVAPPLSKYGTLRLAPASSTNDSAPFVSQEGGHQRKGRRRRSLQWEKRLTAAVLRRFDIACQLHRKKKIMCSCYDLSLLEEAWLQKQVAAPSSMTNDHTPRQDHYDGGDSHPAGLVSLMPFGHEDEHDRSTHVDRINTQPDFGYGSDLAWPYGEPRHQKHQSHDSRNNNLSPLAEDIISGPYSEMDTDSQDSSELYSVNTDVLTQYSDAGSLLAREDSYSAAFACKLRDDIKSHLQDPNDLLRASSKISSLLQSFSLELSRCDSRQLLRDLTFQIHKNRSIIVEQVCDLNSGTKNMPSNIFENNDDEHNESDDSSPHRLKAPTRRSRQAILDWVHQQDDSVGDPLELPETEDAMDHSEFARYGDIVDGSPAYQWLLSTIRLVSSLWAPETDIFTEIRTAVAEVLVPARISRYRQVQAFSAAIDIHWDPTKFFHGQEYDQLPFEVFKKVIVFTGGQVNAQATTCEEYLCSVWPCTAPIMLRCLEALLRDDHCYIQLGHDVLFSGSDVHMFGGTDCVSAVIRGSAILIGELCEQLAWLGATFRECHPHGNLSFCTPFIDSLRKMANGYLFCTIRFRRQSITQTDQSLRGTCWHILCGSRCIVRGFPIPARAPDQCGLEISVGLMAALSQARYLNNFRSTLTIKGFSTLIYPSYLQGNVIGWHLEHNKDGSHMSFSRGVKVDRIDISTHEAGTCRHILGWCSDSIILAGTSVASYNIEHSGLPLVVDGCSLKGAEMRRGILVASVRAFMLGNQDISKRLTRDSFTTNMKWLETQKVVLWDEGDKRGWMVNGPSALLHILRAYIRHMETGAYQSILLLRNEDIIECGENYSARMAIQTLLEPQNRRKKLFVDDEETLQDKIEYFYNVLDQLIGYQEHRAGTDSKLRPQQRRDLLEGWDLESFAASADPIKPRIATIPVIGRSWVDFVNAMRAPILFGRGFGDIIQQSPACDAATTWSRVPIDSYYLTALYSDLPRCEMVLNRTYQWMLQFGENAIWHGPGLGPIVEGHGASRRLDASALVQVLLPKGASDEHRVTEVPKIATHRQLALIFGHNPSFSWSWGESGPPVRGEVSRPPKSAAQRVVSPDSGFWSGSSASTSQSVPPPPQQWIPEIAILCALPLELKAVRALFENSHHYDGPTIEGDSNSYVSGRFGGYNVVASSIGYGRSQASSGFANVMRSFRHLQFCLLVGIGGGIPSATNDVRLGDVVVGTPSGYKPGVVQYDAGKAFEGYVEASQLYPVQPPRELLSAISRLRSAPSPPKEPLEVDIQHIVRANPSSCHPGLARDILYEAEPSQTPGRTSACAEKSCHCRALPRAARPSTTPVVHYGVIASGGYVVKSAALRDDFARRFGALCVEMEAAALVDVQKPCLVIRGICDYADAHKNDAWQEYAAASAAAYAKYLLEQSRMGAGSSARVATRTTRRDSADAVATARAGKRPCLDWES